MLLIDDLGDAGEKSVPCMLVAFLSSRKLDVKIGYQGLHTPDT